MSAAYTYLCLQGPQEGEQLLSTRLEDLSEDDFDEPGPSESDQDQDQEAELFLQLQ